MSICPKTGKIHNSPKKRYWLVLWLLPITGLLSLIWFLVRVIPKPSRAAYPCQRVAFPLASGFVVWLCGLAGSVVAIRKAKRCLVRTRYTLAAICVAFSIGALWTAISITNPKITFATPPVANAPIGVAKGINPGRVVWVRDPNATDWEGPDLGDGHWWEAGHTDQAVVDQMLSKALRELTGKTTDAAAWNELFEHFNDGWEYDPGEKIAIKVNMVHFIERGERVDPDTYDIIEHPDYMNATPQMMLALLKQLVNVVGVAESDITIGDPTTYFPNEFYDVCHDVFPNVNYIDVSGGNEQNPRTAIANSSTPMHWSTSDMNDYTQDYILTCYAEADYIINMGNLKSHDWAGVTFCGKNYYGSFIRYPAQSGFYCWHDSLPYCGNGPYSPDMGSYRAVVDMMGHPHLGRKAMLFLIDGLWAGQHMRDPWPLKLYADPFGGDWSSSIFASQDPVAIDSVAYDALWAEPNWVSPTHLQAGDDYLHEAAQANNPPSGVFYDPISAGDVVRLPSLGTHEHWNNFIDKQYSRNLGTGNGIELLMFSSVSDPGPLAGDVDNDKDVDANDLSMLVDYWLMQRQIPSGLVGHWAFDEGTGTDANDSADSNDGTLVGEPNWVAGKIGSHALDFNGVEDFVSLPDNDPIWLPQNDFTVSCWVYFNGAASAPEEALVDLNCGRSSAASNRLGYMVDRLPAGTIRFYMITGSGTLDELVSASVIPGGSWYHIAAVREGTTQSIYINGSLDNDRTCSANPIDFTGAYDDDTVNVGGFTSQGNPIQQTLNGQLDDVMVFNTALSLEKVRKLYSLAVDLNRDNIVNMTDIAILAPDWMIGTD